MFKKTEINGHPVLVNEETGEMREPRFEMPFREAYENNLLRLILRQGHFQSLIEIYFKNSQQAFKFLRVANDAQNIEVLNKIFFFHKLFFKLTEKDCILDFKEWKANWKTNKWIKEKI